MAGCRALTSGIKNQRHFFEVSHFKGKGTQMKYKLMKVVPFTQKANRVVEVDAHYCAAMNAMARQPRDPVVFANVREWHHLRVISHYNEGIARAQMVERERQRRREVNRVGLVSMADKFGTRGSVI